jgi:hypothetical protein
VRDLWDVEQLARSKLEHAPVPQRRRRRARYNEPDVRYGATLGANRPANMLGPPPPRLVGCSAKGEAANANDLELPLLHDARLVGRFEPSKDYLDLL